MVTVIISRVEKLNHAPHCLAVEELNLDDACLALLHPKLLVPVLSVTVGTQQPCEF